jgi:hypothetical protein
MAKNKTKAAKSVASNAVNVADIAKSNPYIQRLIEDSDLRDNVQKAIESGKSAYGRLSNGKAPHRAIVEDKKLQKDLREAFEAARNATMSLNNAPKKARRSGGGLGRKLVVVGLGGAVALGVSESLRSKVLDALFGKEEEFDYTPPATGAPTAPDSAPAGSPAPAA